MHIYKIVIKHDDMLNICKKISDDNSTCTWLDCCSRTDSFVYNVCQW